MALIIVSAAVVQVVLDTGQHITNNTVVKKVCVGIHTLPVWCTAVLDVVAIFRGIILVIRFRRLLQIFAESATTDKNVEIH